MTREPEEAREALDLIRAVGGDELVRRLLATFVTYADEQMRKASAAATTGDVVEIARVAHALKSSARQLGANALADACERAERDGSTAGHNEAAIAGFGAMERELLMAREWIEGVARGS